MLRLVMLCAVVAMPLPAAAQSSSHDTGNQHMPAKADQRPVSTGPTGPSVQSVPKGWQSSSQTDADAAAKPGCAGDRNVGGFCMIN